MDQNHSIHYWISELTLMLDAALIQGMKLKKRGCI